MSEMLERYQYSCTYLVQTVVLTPAIGLLVTLLLESHGRGFAATGSSSLFITVTADSAAERCGRGNSGNNSELHFVQAERSKLGLHLQRSIPAC